MIILLNSQCPRRSRNGDHSDPLLKYPEDLTEGQASGLKAAGAPLWRGYLLKEELRAVFRAGPERAAGELDRWLARACRCRIPEFVELSRKVRRKRDGILRSIALGVSNARVEAVNNKIKVADQTGLRLQEHGRPDRSHHAQVLGPETGATGEDGFVIPTHTNSRSLNQNEAVYRDVEDCLGDTHRIEPTVSESEI